MTIHDTDAVLGQTAQEGKILGSSVQGERSDNDIKPEHERLMNLVNSNVEIALSSRHFLIVALPRYRITRLNLSGR